jgi:hypothetical protein
MLQNIIEFILFQIEFWLGLLSGKLETSLPFQQYFYLFVVFIALLDFLRRHPHSKDIILVAGFTLLGILNDSILTHLLFFIFPTEMVHSIYRITIVPFWLMSLWFCLAVWFIQANWMNKSYLVTIGFFITGAPLSYLTGLKLDLFIFHFSETMTLTIISMNWFILACVMVCLKRYTYTH